MSTSKTLIDDDGPDPRPVTILRRLAPVFALSLAVSSVQFLAADDARAERFDSQIGHGEVLASNSPSTGGGSASNSDPSQHWYLKVGAGTDSLWVDGSVDPLFPGLTGHLGGGGHHQGDPLGWRDWIPLYGFELNLHHTRFGLSGDHDAQTATLSGLTADGRFQLAFGAFEPAAFAGLGLQFLSWDDVDAPAMGMSYRAGLGADVRASDIAVGAQFVLSGHQVFSSTLPGATPPEWLGDRDVIWSGSVGAHVKWYL